MNSRIARSVCFFLLGFATSACSTPNSEPTAGSESHFLTACDESCASGLSCRCGACTTGCTRTSDCTKLSPAAVCVTSTQADAGPSCELAQTAAHCDVPCSTTGDCDSLGSNYFCSRGYCRPDPLSTPNEPLTGFGLLCQQSTVVCETAQNPPSLVGSYSGQATVKLTSNALWRVERHGYIHGHDCDSGQRCLFRYARSALLDPRCFELQHSW